MREYSVFVGAGIGIESLLMTVGVQMCSAFKEQRLALTVTYFSMVVIGTVVQLILSRSPKSKKAVVEPGNSTPNNPS